MFLITLATPITIGAAAAQNVNPVDYCRENSGGKSERIACLEAAIMTLMSQQTASAPAPEAPETAAPAPVAELQAEPEEPLALAEAEETPSGLGAEQVNAKRERESKKAREKKKEKEKAEAVAARIIDFARSASGRLILVLDNGQVWAQRSSDNTNVRLREGETPEVRIRRGAISGYRMEISDPDRTIIVERLQ